MTDQPEPPLYDRQQALAVAGGNERIADELLALLLRDLPRQQQTLAQAADDRQQLREISHKLHGSARYCGALALQQAARELETALTGGAGPAVVAQLNRRVKGEIQRFLEAFDGADR